VIASDGPYRPVVEKIARKMGLHKKVVFTGYLDSDALDDLYASADVFVIASKTETQGIVLIEAVKNRIPIVALRAPVTADFLAENNYGLVAGEEDFAEKVFSVLSDKKLAAKLVKNYSRIMKEYDVRRTTEQLVDAYRKAIQDSRP
jgi:glycosyltransferase involved in cell wall biosynthesis